MWLWLAGEDELAAKFSKLLAALVLEILEAWKKVENQVRSDVSLGGEEPQHLLIAESFRAEAAGEQSHCLRTFGSLSLEVPMGPYSFTMAIG